MIKKIMRYLFKKYYSEEVEFMTVMLEDLTIQNKNLKEQIKYLNTTIETLKYRR